LFILIITQSILSLNVKVVDPDVRERIARIRNCIIALSKNFIPLNDVVLMRAYESSLDVAAKDILRHDIAFRLCMSIQDMMEE
jgi:hypothetical protein